MKEFPMDVKSCAALEDDRLPCPFCGDGLSPKDDANIELGLPVEADRWCMGVTGGGIFGRSGGGIVGLSAWLWDMVDARCGA